MIIVMKPGAKESDILGVSEKLKGAGLGATIKAPKGPFRGHRGQKALSGIRWSSEGRRQAGPNGSFKAAAGVLSQNQAQYMSEIWRSGANRSW